MNRRATTGIGLATWILGLVALPASVPLQARILLLAPLVIVPRLLDAVPSGSRLLPVKAPGALAAALPLLVALALPVGPLAAAFAVPWLALCAAFGVTAAWRGLRQLPGLLQPARAAELGLLGAFGFLAVAGLFLFFERLGFQPGGFSPEIILLTAVHFHFAGFGLLLVASLLAQSRPRLGPPVLGLLVGIPLTAAGFIAASTALNALGALVTGLSGIGLALALLFDRSSMSRPSWLGWRLAGVALLVGMPMGIAWSVAIAFGLNFLDLDRMVRTHGELNSLAVLLVTVTLPWPERA